MTQFLYNFSLWGNSGLDYVQSLGWFIGILISLKIFREVMLARLRRLSQKTKTDIDDTLIEIIQRIRPYSYLLVALVLAGKSLHLSLVLEKLTTVLLVLLVIYEVGRVLEGLLNFAIKRLVKSKVDKDTDPKILAQQTRAAGGIFRLLIRLLVWSLGLILLLQNLGVKVTSLIAGLGIGGIAVALALQNVLGDLFSAIAIYLDKPFEVGDMIIVGEFSGKVEKVGIKSTRLRSLSGEQVIFANNDLLGSRVRNYKRMQERRIVFNFGLTYQTLPEQLEQVNQWIKEIIEQQSNTRFERAHFKSFGDSSLDFEVVYFVNDRDYNLYMDIQQKINLALMRKLAAAKIEFAFPTRTILMEK